MPTPSPLRNIALVTAAFFLTALAVSGVLPLWLDEILQLIETRGTTASQLIQLLPRHPGAAPLGYLFQHAVFDIAGYSVRWARFPSAIFAAGAVFVTGWMAAQLGMKRPWLASALLAVFPLTLRYASESRTYAPALFFSALATVLFLRLRKTPGWFASAAYCLALIFAVYTQPYAISVGFAHAVWAIFDRDRRTTIRAGLGVAMALISFVPWYIWTKTIWASGIQGAGVRFAFSFKTPLMLFRELVGSGYWGSGILIILFIAASVCRPRESRAGLLLVLLIGVPALVAVAADGVFGYFVATRQIMWVMPAVAVLAGLGIERGTRAGLAVGTLLAVVCIWQTVRYFSGPHENWDIAANAIAAEVNRGACLVVVPAEEVRSYAFFRPELAESHCPATRSVLAITPYATSAQREKAASALMGAGYARISAREEGKSEIVVYRK